MGIDIGSTTTKALVVEAKVLPHFVKGKLTLTELKPIYRSEPVLTPFKEKRTIDISGLDGILQTWFQDLSLEPPQLLTSGALITGLAAKPENVIHIREFLRSRMGLGLAAIGDDPRLESWFAFHGNLSDLMAQFPEKIFLNIDVGGGTSNLAVGKAGKVLDTASALVGARHFVVEGSQHRVGPTTSQANTILEVLKLSKNAVGIPGVNQICQFYVKALENLVKGQRDTVFDCLRETDFSQVPLFDAVTFSGGVGELIYSPTQRSVPFQFGDLGEELAEAIRQSPLLGKDVGVLRPSHGGRATVFGIAQYSMELSGASVYLDPTLSSLPLVDMPVLGVLTQSEAEWKTLFDLWRRSKRGGCFWVHVGTNQNEVKEVANKIRKYLLEYSSPSVLVLLTEANIAKTLGNYITLWGEGPQNILILDQLEYNECRFAQVNRPILGSIPIQFYGVGQ